MFHLDEVSAGNPLVCAAYQIVKQRALFSAFKVSPPLFINFMMAIQVHGHLSLLHIAGIYMYMYMYFYMCVYTCFNER